MLPDINNLPVRVCDTHEIELPSTVGYLLPNIIPLLNRNVKVPAHTKRSNTCYCDNPGSLLPELAWNKALIRKMKTFILYKWLLMSKSQEAVSVAG